MMATKDRGRWYIPFRHQEFQADPGVRRMQPADRWAVLELLTDSWTLGESIERPDGTSDQAWAAFSRLWPGYCTELDRFRRLKRAGTVGATKRWAPKSAEPATVSSHRIEIALARGTKSQANRTSTIVEKSREEKRTATSSHDVTSVVPVTKGQDGYVFAPQERRAAKQTWLTPYAAIYERAAGGGVFPFGEAARLLRPLHERHGAEAVCRALARYLEQTEVRFWSFGHFARTYGEWAGTTPQGVGRGHDTHQARRGRVLAGLTEVVL